MKTPKEVSEIISSEAKKFIDKVREISPNINLTLSTTPNQLPDGERRIPYLISIDINSIEKVEDKGHSLYSLTKLSSNSSEFLRMYGSVTNINGNKFFHLPVVYKLEYEAEDGSIFVRQKEMKEHEKVVSDILNGEYC